MPPDVHREWWWAFWIDDSIDASHNLNDLRQHRMTRRRVIKNDAVPTGHVAIEANAALRIENCIGVLIGLP